jgi:peptidoglycan/xylan/chitin deacetylase (PgdA/CDA1 family)
MKDSNSNLNPFARSTGYRLAEWAACAAIHYSGLDRRLGPLHARPGQVGAILMYHRVHPDSTGAPWQLERRHFRAQIAHLKRNYRVLPLAEMVAALAKERPLPPRAVAVTFDDGYQDNWTEAFPVLRELACPATIFLTAGLVGTSDTMWWDKLQYALQATRLEQAEVTQVLAERHRLPAPDFAAASSEGLVEVLKQVPEAEKQHVVAQIAADLGVDAESNARDRMMTWEEARAMTASGLVTMGAHTVSHRNLKHLPIAEARQEILDSRRILERELATQVDFFAYPFGNPANDYTPAVKAAVREAGFKAAFSVVLGLVSPGDDLFELPRFCESHERWQAPTGNYSRALFDVYLSGARENLGAALKGSA